jgi:hypothetical protein
MHTYIHSRIIPERLAEPSKRRRLRDAQVVQKLFSYGNEVSMTGGKPIAVRSQPISGVIAVNPLVIFYDIGRKGGVLFFFFRLVLFSVLMFKCYEIADTVIMLI